MIFLNSLSACSLESFSVEAIAMAFLYFEWRHYFWCDFSAMKLRESMPLWHLSHIKNTSYQVEWLWVVQDKYSSLNFICFNKTLWQMQLIKEIIWLHSLQITLSPAVAHLQDPTSHSDFITWVLCLVKSLCYPNSFPPPLPAIDSTTSSFLCIIYWLTETLSTRNLYWPL